MPNRIIPTRVGTSTYPYCFLRVTEDHPHACGDKRSNHRCVYQHAGSSPRVWGQAGITFPFCISQGIIPTRVGTRKY